MVNDEVVADLRKFRGFAQITFDAESLRATPRPYICRELEPARSRSIWGVDEGVRVAKKTDPIVMKAIEVMPEAAKMLEK